MMGSPIDVRRRIIQFCTLFTSLYDQHNPDTTNERRRGTNSMTLLINENSARGVKD